MYTIYDIFFCYRKVDYKGDTSGQAIAQTFKLALENCGYRIYFPDDKCSELSNTHLVHSAILHSNNFLLLLTKGIFDGCSNPNDIIRNEIEWAMASDCKIIPISIDNDFDIFPQSLPTSLKKLTEFQIFKLYTNSLFQTSFDFLEKRVLEIDDSNAWVFVSHSNKDFEKIIKVRNKLESLRYKPLLFFLKCLEDDSEIFELIKREIKARDRFILCESNNSHSSKWVQKEIEYIKSLNRPYEIIDLDAEESVINNCIERFDSRSSVYIWSTSDEITDHLSKQLIGKAFKVGILPSTYFNDYLDYKRGFPVKDFKKIDSNAYIVTIIDRELNKNESQVLDSCSDYFRSADGDTFLLYVVSENEERRCSLIRENTEFLKEMCKGNGIQARYIISQGVQSQAELIMKNIVELDNYHNAKQ